jgi:hypothetical protein
MPPMTWIFTGSRQMPDGSYAADATGYIVSTVNFELTLIDVPELASSANETLEWVADPDVVPKAGTAVTMVIEPAGAVIAPTTQPATRPGETNPLERANMAEPQDQPRLSNVMLDQRKIDELKKLWNQKVSPHDGALREAAQAQYEVISQLRREQQRLIDEADRIQRTIDELEKKYQDMTTPRPETVGK